MNSFISSSSASRKHSTTSSQQDTSFSFSDERYKYPGSSLIKSPFIRIKVIEGKDIYMKNGEKKEECDTYCVVGFAKNQNYKTQVMNHTSSPTWNKTYEFDLDEDIENSSNDLLSFCVFDHDELGSDELLATQIMPLGYFFNTNKIGKTEDMWIELHSVDTTLENEVFVSNENIFNALGGLSNVEAHIMDKTSPKFDDKNIPKIHVKIEIMDANSIGNIQVNILDVKELSEEGGLKFKYYVYVLMITRNDGLQWFVQKRFSEINELREALKKEKLIDDNIAFPKKNFLKYTSKFLPNLDNDYQKNTLKRKKILQEFFNELTINKGVYDSLNFLSFFRAKQ